MGIDETCKPDAVCGQEENDTDDKADDDKNCDPAAEDDECDKADDDEDDNNEDCDKADNDKTDDDKTDEDDEDDKADDEAVTDPYNEEYCKLAENSVDFFMKSNRGKSIRTRGEKTVIYRVKLPKVSENSLYTGFFAFGKKNCGDDFIEQLGNGKIIIDILDKKAEYQIVGKYTGQTSKHFNTVFQFDNAHKECDNCYGNKDSDQADLMLHFTGEVDFGTKDKDECLQSLRLGHFGMFKNAKYTEEDVTPCVSWLTKFW